MGVHVDETRRQGKPRAVDDFCRGSPLGSKVADGGNTVARDGDIGTDSRCTGAVDDISAGD